PRRSAIWIPGSRTTDSSRRPEGELPLRGTATRSCRDRRWGWSWCAETWRRPRSAPRPIATAIASWRSVIPSTPSGGGGVRGAGDDVSQTLYLLLINRFETVRLDSLRAEIAVDEGLDQATLTSIRMNPTMVAPGETVEVELSLQPARKDPETRRVTIRIPPET